MIARAFFVGLTCATLFAYNNIAQARETTLAKAQDLRADSKLVAKDGIPIVVLYSLPGCPHCEVIRQSHLTPLSKEIPLRAIVRQIDLGSAFKVVDFAGQMRTHQALVVDEKIKFAPVVVFYDANGKRLGESLIGAMLPDFYGAYFDDALIAATQALRAASSQGSPTKK